VNATAAILTLSREVKLLTTLDDLAREQALKATRKPAAATNASR
jgi:hypothetical protein